jgi:acyl-CoA thioester hydrolase
MARVTRPEIWIRSTDVDADGVVNNAHYFEFFEQARLEHLLTVGIIVRLKPAGAVDRPFTIAETSCRFLAPLRYRDTIVAQAWTEGIRNRSFTLGYRLVRSPEEDVVVAEGTSALVWLDAEGSAAPALAASSCCARAFDVR